MFNLGHLSPEIRWRRPGGAGGVSPAFQTDFTAISALPAGISLSRATGGTRFNSSGVLVTEVIDAPRFDYAWNGSAWVANGLLIEEQRTNLLPTSNPLTNAAWSSNVSCGRAASGNNSPDGTTNATTVTPTAALGSFLYHGFACGSTGTYIASIWLRVISGTGLAYLSLQDAAAASTTSVACSLTTTWTRFQVSRTCTSGNNPYLLIGNSYVNSDASASFEAADGQIEAGSFATSYIPTTSAAVTRSADIVTLTGAALTALQGSAASLILETKDSQSPNFGILAAINSAANYLLYYPSGGQLKTYNGTNVLATADFPNFAAPVRSAVAWSAAGRSLVDNGGTVATDAFATASITDAQIGYTNASTFSDALHVGSIAIYNVRLSNADLQTKSVVGAAF